MNDSLEDTPELKTYSLPQDSSRGKFLEQMSSMKLCFELNYCFSF